VVSKEILSQRTADYQNWVEAFARNHHTPIVWACRLVAHLYSYDARVARAGQSLVTPFGSAFVGRAGETGITRYGAPIPHGP
jgi:hypothetical protein